MNASHLRELMALGLTSEVLFRVAEIIDEASTLSVDKSADIRRGPLESTASTNRKERDKQRKRLARAAEKAAKLSAPLSTDCPQTVRTNPLLDSVVLTSLLSENSIQVSKKEAVRARGTRLAPGTPLSADNRAIIVAEGIRDPERLWVEFVDYWSDVAGRHGVKVSWTGTLRNRCRDVIKRGFNGHGTNSHRTDTVAGRATAREAHHVATMGGAALRYLQEGKSAGTERKSPDGAGTADVIDLGKRAESAG